MSSASNSGASASHATTRLRVPETVRVVNWPLRNGGPRVWLAAFAITTVGLAAGYFSNSAAMGIVCLIAMLFSSWRLWVPVTFEIGAKGVVQTTIIFRWRIPWRCFTRYEMRPRGVWLLTDVEPTSFSTLRGVYVRWADQEEQVNAVLEFFLAPRKQRVANTTKTYAPRS